MTLLLSSRTLELYAAILLATIDWLTILHPALAVILVYPLIGMVVRLGLQARARRSGKSNVPAVNGREHADLGRWLAAAVVGVSLVALTVVISTHAYPAGLTGGTPREVQLSLVLLGTVAALMALWRASSPILRLSFSLITWLGVITLGAQPEVFRLSDNPFQLLLLLMPLSLGFLGVAPILVQRPGLETMALPFYLAQPLLVTWFTRGARNALLPELYRWGRPTRPWASPGRC